MSSCLLMFAIYSLQLAHWYTFGAPTSRRGRWNTGTRLQGLGPSSWAQGSQKPPWWPARTALAQLKVSKMAGWASVLGTLCVLSCCFMCLLLRYFIVVNWWTGHVGSKELAHTLRLLHIGLHTPCRGNSRNRRFGALPRGRMVKRDGSISIELLWRFPKMRGTQNHPKSDHINIESTAVGDHPTLF